MSLRLTILSPVVLASNCNVLELTVGAAAYLSLQSWLDTGMHGKSGERDPDPLLGVLGALDALPTKVRLISQLAIVPAPIDWSRREQRKAIEPALEPERQQMQRSLAAQRLPAGERAPSLPLLQLGGTVLVGLVSFPSWKAWLPAPFFRQVMALFEWFMTPHDLLDLL